MNIIRFLSDNGFNKGQINIRKINYRKSVGSTSSQYNHAKEQAKVLI